jgi:hypothetical protein
MAGRVAIGGVSCMTGALADDDPEGDAGARGSPEHANTTSARATRTFRVSTNHIPFALPVSSM